MVRRRTRRRSPVQQAQAFALYLGGFAGVAYEVVTNSADKPALYAVLGGMLGLPSFIGRDRKDDDDPPAGSNGQTPPPSGR